MCKSNGYGVNSSRVVALHLLWATSCSDPMNQTTISDLCYHLIPVFWNKAFIVELRASSHISVILIIQRLRLAVFHQRK